MNVTLSDACLSALSERVGAAMGLCFPQERWRDLERGLRSAATEFGLASPECCAQWLLSSPLTRRQIEILASHLTVGETYFFREKKTLEALEHRVLPALIRSARDAGRRLRIWSAGCCTGEEPYSIAILLDQLLPDLAEWQILLLATDINPRFLQRASAGVYSEWSFRETPAGLRGRYFCKQKQGCFEILPRIRRMVTFAYLNLAEDVFPSLLSNTNAMDLILCRNVLMYLTPERGQGVVQKFYRCLTEGGWLAVSPSETSTTLFSPFATVNFPQTILYQKDGAATPGREVALPGAREEPLAEFPVLDRAPLAEPVTVSPSEFIAPVPALPEEPTGGEAETHAYQEARALFEQGRYAEAKEALHGALSRSPEAAEALALLARILANEGKLVEALSRCDEAIAAHKMHAGYHYLRALVLQEQGHREEAGTSLRRTLYLDPSFALAHFALGNLAQRRGQPQESRKHFANALALLGAYHPEEILPESEGMTAGRIAEIIRSTRDCGAAS